MPEPTPRGLGVDVYLFPAVVGGGLGDIEEVLAAGRSLERAGFPVTLYRSPGRTLPPSVDGPWDWPVGIRRTRRIRPRNRRALTVSAWWGVCAAPGRDEPLGRAGAWSLEARAVEATYGPDAVIHVSFEEFARTLMSREQTIERYREGGVPIREIARRMRRPASRREVVRFHEAYRRFRGFDRPDVLHLFASFAPSPGFRREFPEAVQTGPLWPGRKRTVRAHGTKVVRPRDWVWYASPSSSALLIPQVLTGLSASRRTTRLFVGPRMPATPIPEGGRVRVEPLPVEAAADWQRRFDSADLRIVTGSRTLLEALEHRLPFLYFNGVIGRGQKLRRHRPEKIQALLVAWKRQGVDPRWRRDLANFASGRQVSEIVRRAAEDPAWCSRFPRGVEITGYRAPFHDAGELLPQIATRFARAAGAAQLVADIRFEGHRFAPALRGEISR
ncbi:MAG: hypothetical protein L3K09_00500 [Thermoplasmata archaeon]|nr:hypothetical protein [Thermoplasmata archaeon]